MTNEESGGRLFIVFLDSTHHDYSWQEEYSVFKPYEEKINFLKVALSNKGLEGIKNRYRNALYYVDALFGKFMQAFDGYQGKEEAVIVVLGDHAEEFYEEGRLFHASSLSHAQTHIPLYYKFGSTSPFKSKEHASMSCQMDIFPTLLHYLTGKEVLQDVLQGRSIFSENRWPFTIMARFNASRNPCEFSIHNGKQKLTATFSDERDIFNAKGLRIISLKNDRNEIISHDLHSIKEHFGDALDQMFTP
jgi:membrane-anchored protein YejM (alkaline phosphatase superfamily)